MPNLPPAAVGGAIVGSVLTVWPRRVARACAGPGIAAPEWIVRGLGVRMLAQGVLVATAGRRQAHHRTALLVAASVDGMHAASMLVAGRVWPRYRRSALFSAGVAGLAASAEAAQALRARCGGRVRGPLR